MCVCLCACLHVCVCVCCREECQSGDGGVEQELEQASGGGVHQGVELADVESVDLGMENVELGMEDVEPEPNLSSSSSEDDLTKPKEELTQNGEMAVSPSPPDEAVVPAPMEQQKPKRPSMPPRERPPRPTAPPRLTTSARDRSVSLPPPPPSHPSPAEGRRSPQRPSRPPRPSLHRDKPLPSQDKPHPSQDKPHPSQEVSPHVRAGNIVCNIPPRVGIGGAAPLSWGNTDLQYSSTCRCIHHYQWLRAPVARGL